MFHIEINTKKRILTLFSNGRIIRQYPVTVGKPSTPTPLGHWVIIKKSLWGEQFGGHFMQLNIPSGIYGIHGTDKPWSISQSISHGCIRMFSKDAEELYNMVPIGTPVHIF